MVPSDLKKSWYKGDNTNQLLNNIAWNQIMREKPWLNEPHKPSSRDIFLKMLKVLKYYSNQSIPISACHLGVSFTFEGYIASWSRITH